MSERRALSIAVHGTVQGVGFRPFVYRLACAHGLAGWVRNEQSGVEIRVEGVAAALDQFVRQLERDAPPVARINAVEVRRCEPQQLAGFAIVASRPEGRPTAHVSPDLAICDECLAELFDPADRRYGYPYINCTNCGPRFTVIEALPYDRANTTMRHWSMDAYCAGQYASPADRRFHAQPLACPACGPHYRLEARSCVQEGDDESIEEAAKLLRSGHILAVKGIGGYHLCCDARNGRTVMALRERKFRKEKPFALMARDLAVARTVANLSAEAAELLCSMARPIVLVAALDKPAAVAPDTGELGIMLPYAPLHHLLFAAGAPELLVMTSANRSSEPIAYEDDDARRRLAGLADAFLIGERPIARRVDDSVACAGPFGPQILRRSRGYAPGVVASLPVSGPLLAVGADLKNTVTLVVGGQAFMSQHIGDLEHYDCLRAFREVSRDLPSMYQIADEDLCIAYDGHPGYASTIEALARKARAHRAVQHHRAHVSSVLAERGAWYRRAVGISFDGTGLGDDGTIWGGEFFVGSVAEGWRRVAHLREAWLPGGDAAARFPVQCAAGFVAACAGAPELAAAPFHFPVQYRQACALIEKGVRSFRTSSVGRLFDAAAALVGFTRPISFEGQAAIWLEQQARSSEQAPAYPFPADGATLDYRPLLTAVMEDRLRGRAPRHIARSFHAAVARGLWSVATMLCDANSIDLVVLSGGVFQNQLLLEEIRQLAAGGALAVWTNRLVPANDGGISLGQASSALFAVERADSVVEKDHSGRARFTLLKT